MNIFLVSTMSVSPTQDEGDVKCLQLGVKQRPSHCFLQCLCNAEKSAFHKSSVAEADRPLGPRIMSTILHSLLYLGESGTEGSGCKHKATVGRSVVGLFSSGVFFQVCI